MRVVSFLNNNKPWNLYILKGLVLSYSLGTKHDLTLWKVSGFVLLELMHLVARMLLCYGWRQQDLLRSGWSLYSMNGWSLNFMNEWSPHFMNRWSLHFINGWSLHFINGWFLHFMNGWSLHFMTGWSLYSSPSWTQWVDAILIPCFLFPASFTPSPRPGRWPILLSSVSGPVNLGGIREGNLGEMEKKANWFLFKSIHLLGSAGTCL